MELVSGSTLAPIALQRHAWKATHAYATGHEVIPHPQSRLQFTLATNSTPSDTIGYLLRHNGAIQLLRHATPVIVQVDALISILATYKPSSLRLFWTTTSIAHASVWRPSTVWDGCVTRCLLGDGIVIWSAISFSTVSVLVLFARKSRPGYKKFIY